MIGISQKRTRKLCPIIMPETILEDSLGNWYYLKNRNLKSR